MVSLEGKLLLLNLLLCITILASFVAATPTEEWRLVGKISSSTWDKLKVLSSPSGKFIAAVYQEAGCYKLEVYNSSLKLVKQVNLKSAFAADIYFLDDEKLVVVANLAGTVPRSQVVVYDIQRDRTLSSVDLPGTILSEVRKAAVTGNYLILLTPRYILWIDFKVGSYKVEPQSSINQALQMLETSRGVVFLTVETFCHICLTLNEKVLRVYKWSPFSSQSFDYYHVLLIVNLDPHLGILFDNGTLGIYDLGSGLERIAAVDDPSLCGTQPSLPDYRYLYRVEPSGATLTLSVVDLANGLTRRVPIPLKYEKGDNLVSQVYDDGLFIVANRDKNQVAIGNFTAGNPPSLINVSTSPLVGLSLGKNQLVVHDYRSINVYRRTPLETRNYNLSLEVLDETGAPVNSFTVEINGTRYLSNSSSFSATLREGVYSVAISKPGYETYTFTARLTSSETRRVLLQRQRFGLKIHAASNAGQPEIYVLNGSRVLCRGVGYLEARVTAGNYTILVTLLNNTYQSTVHVYSDTEVYFILNVQERPPTQLTSMKNETSTLPANKTLVVVYGSDTCAECRALKNQLRLLGLNFTYKDISNQTYLKEYQTLYDMLPVKVTYIPLTLVFRDKCLTAAIIGLPSNQTWREILSTTCNETTYLFLGDEKRVAKLNQSLFYALAAGEALQVGNETVRRQDLFRLIPVIVALALADSINPCTFMVFSALIMAVMSFSGAKKAVYASAAFIVAVYTSYFLLGAGLINFVAAFPQLRYVLALLALVAGSYEVANSALTYREGCSDQPIKLPRPLTGIQKKLDSIQASLLAKAQRGSTVLSFLAGVLVSFTLLPCSSGPYLVAALMISKLPVVQSLACLSLYNVVFVAPLILISLAVIIGGRLMAAMDIASIKINLAKKYTSLMLGVLLIALSLWIMFSP